jgi:hypothetical protein
MKIFNQFQQTEYTPNFQAKFVKYSTVKKYSKAVQNYVPEQVSFVKLEPENKNDILSIHESVDDWVGDIYGEKIASMLSLLSKLKTNSKTPIYAMTGQKDKIETLNPSKILGLVAIQEKNNKSASIEFLQVNPTYAHKNTNKKAREYKNIGDAILDSLKSIYSDTITLISGYWCTKFYETNDFKLTDPETLTFVWKNRHKY